MDKNREQQIRNLLGMAQRARKVVSGNFAVEQAAKAGDAKFLLIAKDAEERSRRAYEELAEKYGIPHAVLLTRENMGACMGKEYRAAAALLDDGFVKTLRGLLENQEATDGKQAGVCFRQK